MHHMGAGDSSELLWGVDPRKAHEVANHRFINAARAFVAQIGKPFIFGGERWPVF